MRLTHLTLKNWRNFKQADFDLQNRLVVVGPNASGKSNLLDALRFLKQVASSGGGFQDAISSRNGMRHVRCLAARNFNHGHVAVEAAIGDDNTPSQWTYELSFTAESRGRHRPILIKESVKRRDQLMVSRPTPEDRDDPERMTQTFLEQVNANKEFRQIADFLRSIKYLHLVPHLIRAPGRMESQTEDPYGSDLLLRIAKTPERTRNRRLQRISLGLQAAVPQLDQLELNQDEVGRWRLEARYQHWRPRPTVHDERHFSDGTLRLIGLLWSLLEGGGKKPGGIVLLEEPELSLHTSIVRQIPTIFNRVHESGGTQVLLTTHSNEILADPGLGADEVVVLKPGHEGTEAITADGVPNIQELLDADLSLAEILASHTAPAEVEQLPDRIHSA